MMALQKNNRLNSIRFVYDGSGNVSDVIAEIYTTVTDTADPTFSPGSIRNISIWDKMTAAQQTSLGALGKTINSLSGTL